MLFRPVRENDLDDIVRLAARAGVAHHPRQRGVFQHKQKALLAARQRAGESVNAAADPGAVGLDEPFYNFRIQKTVRASKALGVYKPQELLNLSADPHHPRQRGVFQHKQKALLAARQRAGESVNAAALRWR
jgi:arginine N-succinyltransferase